MSNIEKTIWCAGCGVEIFWASVKVNNCHYCCKDCFDRLHCHCGEKNELEEQRRITKSSTWEVEQS